MNPAIDDAGSGPVLLNKVFNINKYRSKNWNIEYATRYVLKINNKILEASHFRHFKDETCVKSAIELPISYGCKISCRHCASSSIDKYCELNVLEMMELFDFVVNDNKIENSDTLLIAFSGIGEGAFQRDVLKLASKQIFKAYRNTYYNFTTIGFDISFIDFCVKMASHIPLHYLQISYLHYDVMKLSQIVPVAAILKYNVINIIKSIKANPLIKYRINYVLIKDYNDMFNHYSHVVQLFSEVKHNIVFRISNLNETVASKLYKLKPVTNEVLDEINNYFAINNIDSYVFASSQNDNLNCGQLIWEYSTMRKGMDKRH